MTVRRVVVLVAVLAVGALLAIAFGGTEVTGRATVANVEEISDSSAAALCRSRGEPAQVFVYFSPSGGPDEAMASKAEELAADQRFENIERETQAQAYERFTEIFADEPELIELTRPESLPAALHLTPVDGLTATALLADLRDELTDPTIDRLSISC